MNLFLDRNINKNIFITRRYSQIIMSLCYFPTVCLHYNKSKIS